MLDRCPVLSSKDLLLAEDAMASRTAGSVLVDNVSSRAVTPGNGIDVLKSSYCSAHCVPHSSTDIGK